MHSAVSPRPATLTKADMPTIDFWYEFASTYSYPTAMRIENMAADGGIDVRWRPFLLGPIFKAFGWNDSPFNIFAAKGRYMWRDLERLCEADGLPLKLPPVRFPQNGLKAARLERKDGYKRLRGLCSLRTTPSRRTSPKTLSCALSWSKLVSTRTGQWRPQAGPRLRRLYARRQMRRLCVAFSVRRPLR
jgi:hypothetical protein